MGRTRSRAVVVGLGVAVGSFAAAAMLSATGAPSAHTDDEAATPQQIELIAQLAFGGF